jgi:eukaryotic-like serine/threonine-protein kinase
MSLSTGTRLGPYEILTPLGAGGMGEVYKARDTRLDRTVAIKVLPEHLSQKPELRQRFEREARSISSLNHPHICTLFDVGHQDGIDYLVMEYVEGPSLAERIAQGPLALDESLNLAKQIAEGLEYAHDKGIIHRDLKPANVKITTDGSVKLLDFGLAKALEEPTPQGHPATSPTLTLEATRMGVILGTAAYMSPEQASGKPVDRRSDIWSLGVVLWEMLTGRRLFDGEMISHTLADVLRGEIELKKLPSATPLSIRELMRRCLDRRLKSRLRDIGEARVAIEEYLADPKAGSAEGTGTTGSHPTRRAILPWMVAAGLALIALALGFVSFRHVTEEARVSKFLVLPPEKAMFHPTYLPAVSPDGRRLAFTAWADGKFSIWVRDLDAVAARLLLGTEGGYSPFWSPDSRFIGFFANGKLKKIDVAGGPAVSVCDVVGGRIGSWSTNDVIVFPPRSNSPLVRVPAAGGTPTPVTQLDLAFSERDHHFPWFLPDGRHFLYTAESSDPEKIAVYVADVDANGDLKARRRVLVASSNVVYVSPGYLLFMREGTLMSQPFDAGKAQTTGDPVPIAEQVDYITSNSQGQFSSSQNGVLAYISASTSPNAQLTWFDRSGRAAGTVGTPGNVLSPAISPDGATVAFYRYDPQKNVSDIWLYDVKRGTESRFTFNSRNSNSPVWSPDGSRIAFASNRDGDGSQYHLYLRGVTGAAQDEDLGKAAGTFTAAKDWSHDGRYIVEFVFDPKTKGDIWVLPLFGDRKPFPYLQTDFEERGSKLSPNGQWLAYSSDETKRSEIYVQTFPTQGSKWQVSANGGSTPVWSRDGKELFFIGGDQRLMAVAVKGGAKFEAGVPKPLFDASLAAAALGFDVSKDGRFLMSVHTKQAASVPMTVVLNWAAGLKR